MFGWSAWMLELDERARSVKEVELESTEAIGKTRNYGIPLWNSGHAF